jgi:hypothetical protein
MSLKVWSIRLYPQEKDQVNDYLKIIMELSDPPISKREAFLKTLSPKIEASAPIVMESAREIETLCDLDFLQRIIDPKDGLHKWFCLRGSRPDRKSKPILMGDGRDPDTINKLCEACRTGWSWNQSQKLSADQIQAIKRFGEAEITAHLFVCNHPDTEYIQLSPDPKYSFLCLFTGNRQRIDKKCRLDPCDHLIHQELKVMIKDTPQYEDLQNQLEDKRK